MLYKAECSSKSSKRINWIHVCVVGKGSSYSILFHEPKSSLQKKNWVKVRGNSPIFIKPPNSTSLSNAWGCFLFTHLDFSHIDKDVVNLTFLFCIFLQTMCFLCRRKFCLNKMMLSVTSDFFCYNILINNNTKKQGIKKRDKDKTQS